MHMSKQSASLIRRLPCAPIIARSAGEHAPAAMGSICPAISPVVDAALLRHITSRFPGVGLASVPGVPYHGSRLDAHHEYMAKCFPAQATHW